MENTIKQLLDAEVHAEKLVDEAKAKRKHIVDQALADIRHEEQQFEARLPELHADFLEKAQNRAEQTVGELQRRYQERTQQLGDMAQQHQAEALETALRLLTSMDLKA